MMREFPSLLIDDSLDTRRDSEALFKNLTQQKFTALGEVDKDGDVIDDTVYELLYGFYLLAILDLKIGKDSNLGKEYAELLMEHQPLCQRILSSHVLVNLLIQRIQKSWRSSSGLSRPYSPPSCKRVILQISGT